MSKPYGLEEITPTDPNILLKLMDEAIELTKTAKEIKLTIWLTSFPSGYCHVRVGGANSNGTDIRASQYPDGKRECFKIHADGTYEQIPFTSVNFEDLV